MSLKAKLKLLKEKYEKYKRILAKSDPCVSDQLVDAELRGMVRAYTEIVGVLDEKD